MFNIGVCFKNVTINDIGTTILASSHVTFIPDIKPRFKVFMESVLAVLFKFNTP